MKESVIEAYLVERVKALGGEVRKVRWAGRRNAPDRFVMLPPEVRATRKHAHFWRDNPWVEAKNPDTIKTFPANARERAQKREHARMRRFGETVIVLGTKEQVDEVLA